MSTRRVVTAKNAAGKSVVVSDGISGRDVALRHTPGFVTATQWQTFSTPVLPFDGGDPTNGQTSLLPPPGGSTFNIITFPPDSVTATADFDSALAVQEQLATSPGIAGTFEPDHPGMHTTPTIDYGCVISGEIWLELDDDQLVRLTQGDTVVQLGTRHAWRNRSECPAVMMFVLLGAQR